MARWWLIWVDNPVHTPLLSTCQQSAPSLLGTTLAFFCTERQIQVPAVACLMCPLSALFLPHPCACPCPATLTFGSPSDLPNFLPWRRESGPAFFLECSICILE